MPTFTLPIVPKRAPIPVSPSDLSGEDISLRSTFEVTSGGDYLTVTGAPAAEQSVRREHVANVGELARRPDWGVGVPAQLFKNATASQRGIITSRSRRRLAANPRVKSVELVECVDLDNASGTGLKVRYTPIGAHDGHTVTIKPEGTR